MATEVRLQQSTKARFLMYVTELGMMMEVRPLQS